MKPTLSVAILAAFVAIAFAQAPAKLPSFETAAIKLSSLNEGTDSEFSVGRLRMQGTLKSIIRVAYLVTNDRIEGGPKWLDEDHYEINAKAEGPAQNDELRVMLQSLLAERFGVQFHRVTRTVSGYALSVATSGLKMTVAEGTSSSTHGGRGTLTAENVQLTRLADRLSNLLGEPVVDQTGNHGFFNFTLTWSPEKTNPSPSASTSEDNGPSIFTALQEQLGLKLERQKIPQEFLVIDHATKPSLN